jgi:hypothetical protein
MMQGFRSWSALQRFVSTFSAVSITSFRPFPSLRSVHASSSPQGDVGMEIRHLRRLKCDRRDQAVFNRSLRDIAADANTGYELA